MPPEYKKITLSGATIIKLKMYYHYLGYAKPIRLLVLIAYLMIQMGCIVLGKKEMSFNNFSYVPQKKTQKQKYEYK